MANLWLFLYLLKIFKAKVFVMHHTLVVIYSFSGIKLQIMSTINALFCCIHPVIKYTCVGFLKMNIPLQKTVSITKNVVWSFW